MHGYVLNFVKSYKTNVLGSCLDFSLVLTEMYPAIDFSMMRNNQLFMICQHLCYPFHHQHHCLYHDHNI